MSTSATSLLPAVAAFGLPGAPRLLEQKLSDVELERLVIQCRFQGLLGLLAAAVRSGDLPLSSEQYERVEESAQAWLGHALRLERLVLTALESLAAHGIETRVLKGIALAHCSYPDPSWRVFRDADVLVPASEFGAAARALVETIAVTRQQPELRAGFDERFGKEILLRTPEGLELDLHRTFVEGALGVTLCLADLFASPETFDLEGHTVATLRAPQQLLHAAYTAVLGDWPPRIGAWRDVVQLMLVHDPEPGEVCELARRSRAETVLARAIRDAWTALSPEPRPPLVDWAQSYRPPPMQRFLVSSHTGPARAFTRHAAALVAVPGVSGRLAYLKAIVWPDREYLRARGFTRLAFATRAWERFRRKTRQEAC